MFDPVAIVVLAVALLGALIAFRAVGHVNGSRWGGRALMIGAAILPVAASALSLRAGVRESSQTRFCLSCHEMQPYGKSLFVDDRKALPAVHYQNRLVDRDASCYACHTDYALFGDFKAKVNGLRHVWVHYLGKVPDKPALYQPYASSNCLHCHEDARRFIEAPPHQAVLGQLRGGSMSCLGCHNRGHDLHAVTERRFWQAD